MKKIVFLINSLSAGGAERVLSVIANELVKKYEVEIILLERGGFYNLDSRIKKTFLTNFKGNEKGLIKFLSLPLIALKLKKYIKENNIILIQSHVFRANYVNILAKIFGAKHKAQIVVPGIISFYKKEGLVGKFNLFLIKNLFKKADLIVWKSKGMKYDANKFVNLNKIKQVIINNPYDLQYIERLSNEKIDDFTFNSDKVYLINIGRMESFKRQEWIIKALTYLDKKVELILIGDGKNKINLKKLVQELDLVNRVHFLGKKTNPFKYLKKSDIFVLSSDNGEGFPNVLVEALACELPVVSSDCLSGPREILAPDTNVNKQLDYNSEIEIGKYGVLYPINNEKMLVKSVNIVLKDKELFNKYKKLAKKRAKDFSIEKIIKKYEEILCAQ